MAKRIYHLGGGELSLLHHNLYDLSTDSLILVDRISIIQGKMDAIQASAAAFYEPPVLQARNTLYRALDAELQLLTKQIPVICEVIRAKK